MVDLTKQFFKVSRQQRHRKVEESTGTMIAKDKADWLQKYAQLLHEIKLVLLCSQAQSEV